MMMIQPLPHELRIFSEIFEPHDPSQELVQIRIRDFRLMTLTKFLVPI